ncbi:CpsD/CapB family tyrosine-protein kinase [Gracilibacillus sp. S3-1-1]|uniref:CpsD/CapB family tyrosine-protein kinase n=1 Tax=Gracilibacillus pellucidus TaxID=3095368 RepID=A0ACC6M8C6_9BACI|nr:CpsD/CapB family tyrosine-protein kinase [Gracilibacillus sp. S3-1-1]MDX8047118.1 CpsD/CapB family tyrosine-protein kinase [Gracilibacillus sp. S3-1-1]
MAKGKKQSNQKSMRHLITKMNPRSPIAEQYKTIRTNLQFSSVDGKLQSMLVTSSGPSEGKSSTTANLAIVFAQQGKKVLLIDADMRKPTLHYTFRIDNRRGLSSVLVAESELSDAITTSDVAGLDLLPCGPIPPNPSELLGSRAMETLIANASLEYDLVMFDTPPVLAVTDAQILANLCDGAVMVVRSKQTENDAATKAKELLEVGNAKLLGVVLNDREQQKGHYYYYGN